MTPVVWSVLDGVRGVGRVADFAHLPGDGLHGRVCEFVLLDADDHGLLRAGLDLVDKCPEGLLAVDVDGASRYVVAFVVVSLPVPAWAGVVLDVAVLCQVSCPVVASWCVVGGTQLVVGKPLALCRGVVGTQLAGRKPLALCGGVVLLSWVWLCVVVVVCVGGTQLVGNKPLAVCGGVGGTQLAGSKPLAGCGGVVLLLWFRGVGVVFVGGTQLASGKPLAVCPCHMRCLPM